MAGGVRKGPTTPWEVETVQVWITGVCSEKKIDWTGKSVCWKDLTVSRGSFSINASFLCVSFCADEEVITPILIPFSDRFSLPNEAGGAVWCSVQVRDDCSLSPT